MTISKENPESLKKASECLKNGGILITPTDTVYGFSGICDLKTSQKKFKTDFLIRKIKGREETKPLIQLISSPEEIKLYTDDIIPENILSKWPGALTVIVHVKKECPLDTDLETIAFRCPGDEWLRNVIKECGAPVYSTSVNRSGKPVLEEISSIKAEFEKETDLIIEDGDKKGALPSTLIAINDGQIKILRQGSVIIS